MRSQLGTSGQDRGIGRHTVPPGKTRRTPTNLKTKNNQNCQKIELYGSPTTTELKKKHSSRPIEQAAGWRGLTARQLLEDQGQGGGRRGQGSSWWTGQGTGLQRWWLADWAVPHLSADKPGGMTGE